MSHAHFDEHYHNHAAELAHAPTFARIVAEVSARLVEMWEINPGKTLQWLKRIEAILALEEGRAALWWYLVLQSGDYAMLTDSMRTIGEHRARSKQAVQQELERATESLMRLFPDLAACMHDMRRSLKDYVGEGAGHG